MDISKLDVLAEVCFQRLAEVCLEVKYPDLVKYLKFTSPPLNFSKRKRTKAEKTASVTNDAGIALLGAKRRRVTIDIHGGQRTPSYSEATSLEYMPRKLKDLIQKKGGYGVKLIIEKELFDADVNKGQSRFSMPLRQIISDDFLSENEKTLLSRTTEHGHKASHGLVVGFIEPCLDETTMILKKRNFTRTSSYVLIDNWNKIAKKNGLEDGDTVQAWFFRVQTRPWIALVKSYKGPGPYS